MVVNLHCGKATTGVEPPVNSLHIILRSSQIILRPHPQAANQKKKTNKEIAMNEAIVITPKVLNALRSLPKEERASVATALAENILLGITDSVESRLKPVEQMIYNILRFYVTQASSRYAHLNQAGA